MVGRMRVRPEACVPLPATTDTLFRCARDLTAAGVLVDGVKRPVGPDTRTANRRLDAEQD